VPLAGRQDAPTLPDVQRLPPLDIILVRHATPVPPGTPGWEERDDERPLTSEGLRQADELALELDPYGLSAVYSSPFPRSVQTVKPTAARRLLEVQLIDDLRERQLYAGQRDDWREQLEHAWADPDFAMPGGESSRSAQLRGLRALDLLRAHHVLGGRLLVGSHGNLISLILQALEPAVDYAFHQAMPMPALFHLQHDGIGWRVMAGHGFTPLESRN
jgi:2,3-bisphosphoglycerate-dependent phosphoglycerate mutase